MPHVPDYKRRLSDSADQNLSIKLALTLVLDVVDRETGDYRVERTERYRQRIVKVVNDDVDKRIAGKPMPQLLEHRWGEIHGRHGEPWDREFHKSEEAAIATTEVQNARHGRWKARQQLRFTFGAVLQTIGLRQVIERVISRSP